MKLYKIFSETRFEPSFLFDDGRTRNEIVKAARTYFTNYEFRENEKAFLFFNPQARTNFQVYRDRVVLDIENPSEVNKIKSLGSAIIPEILRKLEVESVIRIGVRAHFIDNNINTSLESSRKIAPIFFSNSLLDFLDGQADTMDTEPRVSFRKQINHEYIMVTNIGVMHTYNGGQPDSTGAINATLQSVNPLLDLDVINMYPKQLSQINGVLTGACTYLLEGANKLWGEGS